MADTTRRRASRRMRRWAAKGDKDEDKDEQRRACVRRRRRVVRRCGRPALMSATAALLPLLPASSPRALPAVVPAFATRGGYDRPGGSDAICWAAATPAAPVAPATELLPSCPGASGLSVRLSRQRLAEARAAAAGLRGSSLDAHSAYPLFRAASASGVLASVSLRLDWPAAHADAKAFFRLLLCRQGHVGFCQPLPFRVLVRDDQSTDTSTANASRQKLTVCPPPGCGVTSAMDALEAVMATRADDTVARPSSPLSSSSSSSSSSTEMPHYLLSDALPLPLSLPSYNYSSASTHENADNTHTQTIPTTTTYTADMEYSVDLPHGFAGDYFVVGHVILFLNNEQNNDTTATLRVDMANAIPGNIITLKDMPIIQEPSLPFVIAISVLIGISFLWQTCLLLSLHRHCQSVILQVAQVPFLALLVVCGAVVIASSVFYIPLNDAFCNLRTPLTLLPYSVIGSVLVGRVWRAHAILSTVLAFAAGGRKKGVGGGMDKGQTNGMYGIDGGGNATDAKMDHVCDRRLAVMSFLTRLSDWGTVPFPHRGADGRWRWKKTTRPPSNKARCRGNNLRGTVTNQDLVRLVTILTLPQVVLQVVHLSFYPEEVFVELNDEGTMGVTKCTLNGQWIVFSGIMLVAAIFLLAVFVSWVASDLPSVFNEKNSIFNASWIAVILILVGTCVRFFTAELMLSPDLTAGLQIGFCILFAFVTSWVLVLPKLLKVWKGETLILSDLVKAVSKNGFDPSRLHNSFAPHTTSATPCDSDSNATSYQLQETAKTGPRESIGSVTESGVVGPIPKVLDERFSLAGTTTTMAAATTAAAVTAGMGKNDLARPFDASHCAGTDLGRVSSQRGICISFRDDGRESDLSASTKGNANACTNDLIGDSDDDEEDSFDREIGGFGNTRMRQRKPSTEPMVLMKCCSTDAFAGIGVMSAVPAQTKFSRFCTTGTDMAKKNAVVLRKDEAPPRRLELAMLRTKEDLSIVSGYTLQGRQPPLAAWRALKLDAISLGQQMESVEFGWTESEARAEATPRPTTPNVFAKLLSVRFFHMHETTRSERGGGDGGIGGGGGGGGGASP